MLFSSVYLALVLHLKNFLHFSKKYRRQRLSDTMETSDADQTDHQVEQIAHDKQTDRHSNRRKNRPKQKTKPKLVTNRATSISELCDTNLDRQTENRRNRARSADRSVTDSELAAKSRHVTFTAKSDSEITCRSRSAVQEPFTISLNLNQCGCSVTKCTCSETFKAETLSNLTCGAASRTNHVRSRRAGARDSHVGKCRAHVQNCPLSTFRHRDNISRSESILLKKHCQICRVDIGESAEQHLVCQACSLSLTDYAKLKTNSTSNRQTDRHTDLQSSHFPANLSHFRAPSWCSTLIRWMFALLLAYLIFYTLLLWLSDNGQCPGRSWRWWRQLSPSIGFRTYTPQPH